MCDRKDPLSLVINTQLGVYSLDCSFMKMMYLKCQYRRKSYRGEI